MRRGAARKSAQRRFSIGTALDNNDSSGLCPTTAPSAPPNWRGNCRAQHLERASESLIPRLGGGDAAHDVLTVAYVEIEVREELLLGQGIGRVDTEVRNEPGRAHTRCTAHLNAPPDTQAIGQAGLERGGHVEITLALELCPEGVSQCSAGYLPGAGVRCG